MLFSYLLLGSALGLLVALLGFGLEGFGLCVGLLVAMYFCTVTVRGFTVLIRQRRVTFQLVDLGAFLFAFTLYAIADSYSEKAGVLVLAAGLGFYFAVTFWASKRIPMTPSRDWTDEFPTLPVLWNRHLRRNRRDSSVVS
ncbi:MAG TPA: hypothetical protein VGM16_09185 [Gammaproteobacteria bacterium]|jgi:hypothetical protein